MGLGLGLAPPSAEPSAGALPPSSRRAWTSGATPPSRSCECEELLMARSSLIWCGEAAWRDHASTRGLAVEVAPVDEPAWQEAPSATGGRILRWLTRHRSRCIKGNVSAKSLRQPLFVMVHIWAAVSLFTASDCRIFISSWRRRLWGTGTRSPAVRQGRGRPRLCGLRAGIGGIFSDGE